MNVKAWVSQSWHCVAWARKRLRHAAGFSSHEKHYVASSSLMMACPTVWTLVTCSQSLALNCWWHNSLFPLSEYWIEIGRCTFCAVKFNTGSASDVYIWGSGRPAFASLIHALKITEHSPPKSLFRPPSFSSCHIPTWSADTAQTGYLVKRKGPTVDVFVFCS